VRVRLLYLIHNEERSHCSSQDNIRFNAKHAENYNNSYGLMRLNIWRTEFKSEKTNADATDVLILPLGAHFLRSWYLVITLHTAKFRH
jgi:hypothetical protein